MSVDLLARPEQLTPDYKLVGPDGLYITGDLESAVRARDAGLKILNFAERIGAHPPKVDDDLLIYSSKISPRGQRQHVRDNHGINLLKGVPRNRHELLVVGDCDKQTISQEMTYLLGKAVGLGKSVAKTCVERVYYLGPERELGTLVTTGEITVIQDPLEVFRWQHPAGPSLRVASQ